MSTLMMSELLSDLSPEQQQLLAGGANGSEDEGSGDETDFGSSDSDEESSSSMFGKGSGVYKINSKCIVRVKKLKKS
ncbi:hypothetical protein VB735_09525 [Halotia wernerae UHCC 0503]|nr:hypothetical protein [Halotia wernerae UHCC 0503]